jgi:hypothetical protein
VVASGLISINLNGLQGPMQPNDEIRESLTRAYMNLSGF